MADTVSKTARSAIMRLVRSRGNQTTELRLIALLRAAQIKGWRRHAKILGRPDFIFPKARVAIFVDGCFWHGCKKHGRLPSTNRTYWHAKIARNLQRDRATKRALVAKGWTVIRIWEHALKKSPTAVIAQIACAVAGDLPRKQ